MALTLSRPDGDLRPALSALWTTVLINALLRDAHEILRPGFLHEVMGGTLNGTVLSDGLFVGAALILQIPVMLVALTHILPLRGALWINLVAAPLVGLTIVAGDRVDTDDWIFAGFQLAALAGILAIAAPSIRRAAPIR
ncbi:MAG: DUF6326 family protein [Rhodobacter sp.]|nr:DUF6326 family protein [Rhodobacter sp.]